MLQLLADGAGTAIAENQAWHQADRERDQRLTELRQQHLDLLEKLSGMETRERSLLAEAIQRIVAGILRLDHLSTRSDQISPTELNKITELLVTTVDWLRNFIVVALTPPDLAAGLGPALAALARGIFTSTPTVFTLASLDHVPLSVPAKETAFRIFREALTNVRKHAHANNATLHLEERDSRVVISLTDDGVGSASLDAGPGHLGVASMRARADAEDGQLHLKSVPSRGTVVTLTLPALPTPGTAGPTGGVPHRCSSTSTACAPLSSAMTNLRDAVKPVLTTVPRFHVIGEAPDGRTCLERARDLRPTSSSWTSACPSVAPTSRRPRRNSTPESASSCSPAGRTTTP